MPSSSPFQTPAAYPHSPPPHAPRPQWPYAHRFHEHNPEDYPSASVTPSPATDPADMPEPSPILEHPELTDSPPHIAQPALHDTLSAHPARDAALPPLPANAEASLVPAAVRLPDPTVAIPRHTNTPPPIVAPTPALARANMSRSQSLREPTLSHQRHAGSSSDESPVSDHARPGTAQARPRNAHRASSSVNYVALGPDTHHARALSYNSGRPQSRRNDRPQSTGLTGVGPDPYGRAGSALDYVVPPGPAENPGDNKRDSKMGLSMTSARENTVKERLQPTINHAIEARVVAKRKARLNGYALNVCIGIQVVLGAITTGVAAASTTSRTSTSVGIPILGGLSTLAASYLARARGSGEPERSIVRAHDLDHFIRDAEAFLLDNGHLVGAEYNAGVQRYRERFEEIMGHNPSSNHLQQLQPKELEAGLASRPMSPNELAHIAAAGQHPMYAAASAHPTQPGQLPAVSPMHQTFVQSGGYFSPAAQAASPHVYAAPMGYGGVQVGYASGGAQAGAAVQVPQMAHVLPTVAAGYTAGQPGVLGSTSPSPMPIR